jgi:ketol-acid reductoisomerase
MPDASEIVDKLLEGGMECYVYSPEDLAEYQRLKAEQQTFYRDDRLVDPATGQFTPEWVANWTAFEKLRNKYNGMPPKQLADAA